MKFRIDVTYVGPTPIDEAESYTVIYEVQGGEDVLIKNFKVEGGQFTYDEEMISTAPDPVLSAKATRVLDN